MWEITVLLCGLFGCWGLWRQIERDENPQKRIVETEKTKRNQLGVSSCEEQIIEDCGDRERRKERSLFGFQAGCEILFGLRRG